MDIKEFIQRLQSIDAKDLKNIDFSRTKEILTSRMDILIIICLIVITLFATINIYNGRRKKSETLSAQVSEMEEKLEVANQNRKIKKEFDEFIANYPDYIPVGQLINKLSEFAIKHNVQIVNFFPATESSDDYTALTTVKLNIAAEDYKNIILFIEAVETAPYAIAVQRWSGKIKEDRSSRRRSTQRRRFIQTSEEEPKTFIEAEVAIESVKIKDK